ncbi:MAG TPA: hypothetical protein VEW64_00495, partial [Methyloceanibacter sp.]|nr:hypothetical protein [Methyloceanibacter sp.]
SWQLPEGTSVAPALGASETTAAQSISSDAIAAAANWRAGNKRTPVRFPQAAPNNTPKAGCNNGKLHAAREAANLAPPQFRDLMPEF